MRVTRCLAVVASLFALSSLASGQTLSVKPERDSGLYQPGEDVRWVVTATEVASLQTPTYSIKSGGLTEVASGALVFTNGTAVLTQKSTEPGWWYLEVKGKSKIGAALTAAGGALVGGEKIAPGVARPADFDAFWDEKLAALAAIPVNPVVTTSASGRSGVDYATVKLDGWNGTHVQGQLARPTAGTKFPAMLIVQWAGVYSLQKSWVTDRAAEGWLVLNTQAHDITPVAADSYYTALSNGELKDYQRLGNENRETSYFLRMFLACQRAVDYLASRPDWDGTTLVVTGASQGGMQGLVTAALDHRVTSVAVDVPAGSDQGGLEVGRVPGWPQWAWQAWDRDLQKVKEASRYFDVTNFAQRIRCPVLIGVGMIDTTVPVPGVFATYNLLTGAKEVIAMPGADHQNGQQLYNTRSYSWLNLAKGGVRPVIKVAPVAAQAPAGAKLCLSVVAEDSQGPLGYQWYKDGVELPGKQAAVLELPALQASDAGAYKVVVRGVGGAVESTPVAVTVSSDTLVPPTSALINLSTRGLVGTGNEIMIAGFVIRGEGTKQLLIRAVGPTLQAFGISGRLANPSLTLTTGAGVVIAGNDNWATAPSRQRVRDAMGTAGAFSLPEESADASLLVSLPAGNYTALVSGVGATTGIALVEVYDLDPASEARLINLSTRGKAGRGEGVLICGFVMAGGGARDVLIRAMGPSLKPLGLPESLAATSLALTRQNGDALAQNEGWESSPDAAAVSGMSLQLHASPALGAGALDSALLQHLEAGVYTALVRGVGETSGLALVEMYALPSS